MQVAELFIVKHNLHTTVALRDLVLRIAPTDRPKGRSLSHYRQRQIGYALSVVQEMGKKIRICQLSARRFGRRQRRSRRINRDLLLWLQLVLGAACSDDILGRYRPDKVNVERGAHGLADVCFLFAPGQQQQLRPRRKTLDRRNAGRRRMVQIVCVAYDQVRRLGHDLAHRKKVTVDCLHGHVVQRGRQFTLQLLCPARSVHHQDAVQPGTGAR